MDSRQPLIIRLHPLDNVVVASTAIPPGTELHREGIKCKQEIPAGHKIATALIKQGTPVRKYGQTIGFANRAIEPGEHVHSHNLEVKDFERDYAIGIDATAGYTHCSAEDSFEGILRPDGRVATRNYIGVISTVNCSASVVRSIASAFGKDTLAPFPNIDGVVPLCHSLGCAMSTQGEGFDFLHATIQGWAMHPNFAAVLLVGLGCEVLQIEMIAPKSNEAPANTCEALTIQEMGGTRRAIQEGIKRVQSMLPHANRVKRQRVPVSHLTLGLQCGGSDGYSGITGNPALGIAVDILVAKGGTAILGETPEIYGAEHLLVKRAATAEVGKALLERIRWWEDYTAKNGAQMDNNPTPGNKAGGLTTILEKSLGAVAKAGTTPLNAVHKYAEPIAERGLVFMDTPGYDPVSLTGMVAGGANIIAFTTGRGSAYGCKPVPSIKLASNSAVYHHMAEDMDINCGELLEGTTDLQGLGEQIYKRILAVASGQKTKSEKLAVGDNEFVPWHIGAVL